MKIEVELTSEQFQKLVDVLTLYDGQIKHLKGRVRNLENMNKQLVKALEDIRISREQPEPRAP